jgi:hypothetical protein
MLRVHCVCEHAELVENCACPLPFPHLSCKVVCLSTPNLLSVALASISHAPYSSIAELCQPHVYFTILNNIILCDSGIPRKLRDASWVLELLISTLPHRRHRCFWRTPTRYVYQANTSLCLCTCMHAYMHNQSACMHIIRAFVRVVTEPF